MLEESQKLLTVDHGRFIRIINRGELGTELDWLDKKLDLFGDIFRVRSSCIAHSID